MKILYVTNHISAAKACYGYINDYLNDLLFHGLYELENVEVVDSTPIIHLYKENKDSIPIGSLWGKGFTSAFLIDKDTIDRSDIEQKISDKYYDLIIYGSVYRCLDYYDLITAVYPSHRIFIIDGEDMPTIHPLSEKHPYFKRELTNNKHIPIHFAIPECKITDTKEQKQQEFGIIIPGISGYVYDKEHDYYADYRKSFYGITKKKGGWDCMRHYEILANYCMPYFENLEGCPEQTLTNLPKHILVEAKELKNNFRESIYYEMMDFLFTYTKAHLTTKNLARHVLSYV